MYEPFFGLRERPFDLTTNPGYLVMTEVHREALSNLEYGISSRKGVTLLLGEAGSGKTTLLCAAISRQTAGVHCVHLNNPALSRVEFIEMLARRFGLSESASRSKTALLDEMETCLRARRAAGETTVLIVDEAQTLSPELLEEIRLLANIEAEHEKLLLLILAGQPELAERLNDKSLRQLKQRVALRCELRPLTLQETAAYVAGRIKAAGGTGAKVFTLEAVTGIFEASHGIPRLINVIADNALVGAFAKGQRPVRRDVVAEVCRDFDLPLPESQSLLAPPARHTPHAAPTRMLEVTKPVAVPAVDAPTEADTQRDPGSPGRSVARLLTAPDSRWRRFFLEKRSVQR